MRARVGGTGTGTGKGYRDVALDLSTRALETIDYAHHEIHNGGSYTVSVGQTVSDANDKTAVGFTTPATAEIHMVITAAAGAGSWLYVREGPTIANNQGAATVVYNRNRNSTKTCGLIDTATNPNAVGKVTYFAEADQGDYTENGALIYQELLSSGNKSKDGGASRGTSEIILAAGTAYLIYLKEIGSDACTHNIVLDFYEHTPKT